MKEYLSFNDVLISPLFSNVISRKDVDTNSNFLGINLALPVISSNMDTITEEKMASALAQNGAIGCLHRFWSIEDNVKALKNVKKAICSIGLGEEEILRAEALVAAGATHLLIDVAHGASRKTVEQYDRLKDKFKDNVSIIVGNFATAESIRAFQQHSKYRLECIKVGIGGGSVCETRVVTGCGIPTLGSIMDCSTLNIPIIADGGIRNSGDIVKSIVAGASTVMLGYMFSGTDECPGELIDHEQYDMESRTIYSYGKFKKYRGSASAESYNVQSKTSEWRAPEGASILVPYKGSVKDILQQINGGIRSAMSYVDATTLKELKDNAQFIRITSSGYMESEAHGKNT